MLMDRDRATVRTAGPAVDAASVATAGGPVRDYSEWALIAIGFVLLFTALPHWVGDGFDGAVRFQALTDFLAHTALYQSARPQDFGLRRAVH